MVEGTKTRKYRQKYLKVSAEFILDLLKLTPGGRVQWNQKTEKWEKVSFVRDPIPETAKVVGLSFRDQSAGNLFGQLYSGFAVFIKLEDESFDEIEEGKLLPELQPTYSLEVIDDPEKELPEKPQKPSTVLLREGEDPKNPELKKNQVMAASNQTVDEILKVLSLHVPTNRQIKEIVSDLRDVPGNKSFRDTIEKLWLVVQGW